jgi:phosphoglycolate phosphatase-like HAD superfamily hydrolase
MDAALIETIQVAPAGARICHALFDFDGTLSLLREGWQQVMTPLMVAALSACPQAEPLPEIERLVADYIATSTGIQTIHQMIWLAEAVAQRGGQAPAPEAFKAAYLARLDQHIADRLAAVRAGSAPAADYTVPGARETLCWLRQASVICHLASGTDVANVRQEAELLGLNGFFAGIHGALADWRNYSKAQVIANILADGAIAPAALITFGDGYVEIENTRTAGGVAVGVATDEAHRGQLDRWKRQRLISAGAHYILADLRPAPTLLKALGVG